MNRHPLPLVLTVLAWLAAAPSFAAQYRSEQRVVETPQQTGPQQSPQQLLQNATDPYEKALLLRDMAAQAAQQHDYSKAVQYLEQALSQHALSGPAAAQMRNDLSQIYMSSGDLQKLLPQLEAQAKSGQATPQALAALASAYVNQKRYGEAVTLLQKAGANKPDADPSWRRALAAAYIGSGREREALPMLEQLLKEDPTHRDDWMRLAALQLKAGERVRAAATMELASRLGFLKSADEQLQLVTLTAQIGAPFEAGSLLQSLLDRKAVPDSTANRKLLAQLWLAAREDSLALPALQAVVVKAPSAALYQQIAQLHLDRDEYREAATALQQAIRLGKPDGKIWLALGFAKYQQADVDGALSAFREAAKLADGHAAAGEWIHYLESGRAREQAMLAASERAHRADDDVRLSDRLGGDGVALGSGGVPQAVAATGSGSVTPIGADASANADGSIPAWAGGLQRAQWPAGFHSGQRLADPYPADRPLFVITQANLAQYRNRLSAGHLALFAKYPDYRMPVYVSRRSVAYPKAIYEASQANIGKARLTGSDELTGARLGVPFPKPQSGVEIMWNHRTRYRGNSLITQSTQAIVRPGGSEPQYLKQTERVLFRYGNSEDPIDLARDNILLYYLTWFGKTRSDIDFVALVHETANSVKQPRNMWVIPPGVPKMFRVPPIGYDQPFPGSDGIMFLDMLDMYNGAFDRYVWKLAGKRELYIPYNSYRLSDGRDTYATLLTPKFFNPADTRYELHRVWVIEATERGGTRHSFGKRTFYVDEDSWNVVLVENEDHGGQLWRFQEGHLLPAYDAQSANCAPVITYDLKDGRYFVNRLLAQDPPMQSDVPMRTAEFLPDAVRARYGRF
jgi:tetratricopeptide (TPR) repeat protein